jgi:hypothetical protein
MPRRWRDRAVLRLIEPASPTGRRAARVTVVSSSTLTSLRRAGVPNLDLDGVFGVERGVRAGPTLQVNWWPTA